MRDTTAVFESHRGALVALAYRMLGDVGRAEDVVQEAWLRWHGHSEGVESPKAFLVTVVTRLCLNELGSARARREESRSDRLPEPVDLRQGGVEGLETADRMSMAFLVLLQRLTPAERAVLLLREVFDFDHGEIAALVDRSEAACRQLLKRARENVAAEKRVLEASPEEHRRLLTAFVAALQAGDLQGLTKLLADDAVVIADGGPQGVRIGRVRTLPRPLTGV
ncbi:MAG TPA: sigma-70 family RNA polymerase sigma factor, partial [Polyangiaceae bacterium]